MGIFDSIKNALGKGESEPQVTVAPSQVLREGGIDPSGLKFSFGNRSITVSGSVASGADRQKVVDLLSGMDGIDTVQNNIEVAAPPSSQTIHMCSMTMEMIDEIPGRIPCRATDVLCKSREGYAR